MVGSCHGRARAHEVEGCGAARPTGARHAGSDGLKLSVDAAMKRARFSAAALPTWHFFLGGLALSLPAATRNGWCAWSR